MNHSNVIMLKTEFAPAERLPKEELLRQHQLWAAHEQTNLFCTAVPTLLLILNECRQIVYSNEHFNQLKNCSGRDCYLGLRPGELFGCVHACETEGGCGTTVFCRNCGAAKAILLGLSGKDDVEECEIDPGKDQSLINLRVWTSPVKLEGEIYTIFSVQDISIELQNKELLEKNQKLAILDSLTGVFNRRAFFEAMNREINRSLRYHNPFSIEMIDLDDFKNINDTYGHPVGDALLVEVTHRISEQLRDVDILARYGGDEFIVMLPETGLCGGLKFAERLRQSVEGTPFEFDGHSILIAFSIGIAEYRFEEDKDIDSVIARADKALYADKKKRKQD